MSHGLDATAKAIDVALRQISFFFFILITLLIGLPFQTHFAALPTRPTAPEPLPANSGLSSQNDRPLCLHPRTAQPQPRSPLDEGGGEANYFCASRRPPKATGGLEPPPPPLPSCPSSARPGWACCLPEGVCLPRRDQPLLPGARRCPAGTAAAGTKPGPAPLRSRPGAAVRGGSAAARGGRVASG